MEQLKQISSNFFHTLIDSNWSFGTVEFEPCPAAIYTVVHLSLIPGFVCSSCLFCTICYCVLTKTPKEMSSYKWYILWHACCFYTFEFALIVSMPEPIFPYPFIALNGITRFFQLGYYNYYLLDLVIFDFFGGFISAITMCIIRYTHTLMDGPIQDFFYSKRAIVGIGFVWVSLGCILFIPFHLCWATTDEIKALLEQLNPNIYETYKDKVIMGAIKKPIFTLYGLAFIAVPIFAIPVVCIIGTYRFLRQNKQKLSAKTYSLFWNLITALVVECFLALSLVGAPVLLMMICFCAQISFTSCVAYITGISLGFFPICTHMSTLYFVTPYRRFIWKKIKGVYERIDSDRILLKYLRLERASRVAQENNMMIMSTNINQ